MQALGDSEQIAATRLRIASLYEQSLGEFEKAGKAYREVLETDSGNLTALRGLERVSEKLSDWPELVRILERELDVVETERERVEVLLKLAQNLEEHFLKFDQAAQRLEQALEISPAEERAYVALARCYRRLKQWLDLINAYERHIAEAASAATKIEVYAQIAQVYSDEVGDVDRAIDAYRNIVDLDETNVPALDALAKLYEKQGDAAQAIDAMTRVADLTTDGIQRVEMYYRIGKALDEKLADRVQARDRFEMALDLDPTHLATLAALRTIAIDESDWDRAARYLEQEQSNTPSARSRAKLLVELGKLRDEMLGEHDSAVQAWELAIQADPDSEDAAMPLVQEYDARREVRRKSRARSPRCSSRRARARIGKKQQYAAAAALARSTRRSATSRRRSKSLPDYQPSLDVTRIRRRSAASQTSPTSSRIGRARSRTTRRS